MGTLQKHFKEAMEHRSLSTVKCVTVGDGCVGKTCLLVCFARDEYPVEYIPTVFDNYATDMLYDDRPVCLHLWDTAGQREYDRLRPLSYPNTDVFLLVFSVVSRNSFNNVKNVWLPEIREHCPDCPFVLVGTKCDLRTDEKTLKQCEKMGKPPVSVEEAEAFAKEIGAFGYQECSALRMIGIREVFKTSIDAACKPKVVKPSPCRLF